MLGRGNVLIAQGTHGRIYKISNSQVAKVFENRVFNKECVCSRIRTSCKTTCDHIHHEYLVQKLLYDELMGKTQIKIKIPDWVPGLGGKMYGIPPIPLLKMATGGVVYPQSGGVPAILAEAGRPERVEPLDANGLSARDKALIAQMVVEMTGGRGGGGGELLRASSAL